MTVILQVVAALKSLAQLADLLRDLISEMQLQRQEKIQKELENYKQEVRSVLTQIENAKTNEDRKHLSRKLAESLGK